AYVVGMFRLLSLTHTIFPPDRRRAGPGAAPVVGPRPRRPSGEVGPEVSWLALSLALWTGLAVLARFVVADHGVNGLGFAPEAWRVVSLVWLAGVVLIVAASVAGYLRLRGASEAEARMYLQDQL